MRILAIAITVMVLGASAQEQPPPAQERERALWSTEFRQNRPGPAAPQAAPPSTQPAGGLMLGLTTWRLRPAQPSEKTRILLHERAKTGPGYAPERLGADTLLAAGDFVRITVEPGRSGYLYVASREVYSGGRTGDAYLVFPSRWIRGGRAAVGPGEVVEVPEWSNETPYLTLQRSKPDQIGEQIFLLLTRTELPGLMVESEDPPKLPMGTLAGWVRRWGAGVHMLDTPDQKGAAISPAEHGAAANAIRLRPGDPIPQILFRAPATVQDGILATFTLRLKP